MTVELTMLVCAVGLWIVQLLVAVTGGMMQFPAPVLAGNRETPATARDGSAVHSAPTATWPRACCRSQRWCSSLMRRA